MLGSAFSQLGQHNKAIELYTKYLNILRELGNRVMVETVINILAQLRSSYSHT